MCAPITVSTGGASGGCTGACQVMPQILAGGCTGACQVMPQILASLGIVGVLIWNFRNLLLRRFQKAGA